MPAVPQSKPKNATEPADKKSQPDVRIPASAAASGGADDDKSYLEGVEVLTPPDKSEYCRKEFRSLRLANGLRVLLVSDHYRPGEDGEEEPGDDENSGDEEEGSEEEGENSAPEEEEEGEGSPGKKKMAGAYKAAAALSIGWGSVEDPQDLEGLMHFLEHMVFMGSDKYPQENGFDDFITRHGGRSNAFTDKEHTNFHFEINSPYLWEGLDRFAQFFVAPLMKKDAMEREREAVDSEFTEAMPSDTCRLAMLQSSLAPEGHPARNFSWGNTQSLSTYDENTVHARLHEYRKKFYSAQYMSLVVQARQPIERIEKSVIEIFSHVPNNGLPAPDYSALQFPFPPERVNRYIRMEALKAKSELELTWFMEPVSRRYRTQQHRFLSMLLGHEGHGSLLSYFKKKNWACGLETDCDVEDMGVSSLNSFLSISVELTDNLELVPDIISAVFEYIAGLRANPPSRQMFEEFKALAKLNYDFAEETDSSSYVESMASAMTIYEPKDYVTGSIYLFEYDEEMMQKTVDFLTPSNVCISLSSKKNTDFSGADVKTERWFGTRYKIDEISPEWREKFNHASTHPNPELHLPLPNKYIVSEHSELLQCWPRDRVAYPQLIMDDAVQGKLYHEPHHNYGLPYTEVRVLFQLEKTGEHAVARFSTVMSLLIKCYSYHLMEQTYDTHLAKFQYTLTYTPRGLKLVTSGFPQHMQRYMRLLLDGLRDFESKFSEVFLASLTDRTLNKLYNAATDPCCCQKQLRLRVLLPEERTSLHVLQEMPTIIGQEVLQAARGLLRNARVKILVQGNSSDAEARAMFSLVQEYISRDTDGPTEVISESGYRVMPAGVSVVRVAPVNDSNGNSAVTNYYQGPPGSLRNQVLIDYVACAMEERCFDTLRTKEQLSYSVHSGANESNGVIGLSINVDPQAAKYSVDHVDGRIETFLASFAEELAILAPEAFETLKETMVDMKRTHDEALNEECYRNWSEITVGDCVFDRDQRQIPIIQSMTKEEVLEFYRNLVDPTRPVYRKLSVQVEGHPQHTEHKPPPMDTLKEAGISYLRFLSQPVDVGTQPPTFLGKPRYVLDVEAFKSELVEKPYHSIVE